MEPKLPLGLRVVSAEIETPGHSPREDGDGVASPGLAAAGSGDSFTAALRHHASRLRHAVMSQRVGWPWPPAARWQYTPGMHRAGSMACLHVIAPACHHWLEQQRSPAGWAEWRH